MSFVLLNRNQLITISLDLTLFAQFMLRLTRHGRQIVIKSMLLRLAMPSSLLKYYLASSGGVKFWQKILIYYV